MSHRILDMWYIGFTHSVNQYNDSKWSLLHSEAWKLFLRHSLRVLSSSRPCQALIEINKQNYKDDKTWKLSLSLEVSPPIQLGWKMVPRQAGHSTAHKWLKFDPSHENSPFPKIHPKPQHTSNPLQAPPARLLTSSPPPCWLAGWQRVGGPPS